MKLWTLALPCAALAATAQAQSVEKCNFANGVISMPNYVIPLYISNTGVVKDISVSGLASGALVAVFSASNPGVTVCGYGVGNDRCGSLPPVTDGGGAGWLPNPSVLGLRAISNTAMTGLKVAGDVTNTRVGIGLCSM